uniref:CSON003631 protein n=1 Tax=Culicoides sonorensis TaxID=179676 RepID=A0A336MLY9_CULSO
METQTTKNDKLVQLKNTKNEVETKKNLHSNLLYIDEDENGTEVISDEFDQEIDKNIEALDDFGDFSEEEPYVELDVNLLPQNGDVTEIDVKNNEVNNRLRTVSGESSGSSEAEENLADTIKKAPIVITEVVPYQPPPFALAFTTGRRLSECKEEDEIESENGDENQPEEKETKQPEIEKPKEETPQITVVPATPEHKKSTEINTGTRRFIVTKASPTAARHEINLLKDRTVKHNSQTIHFPCSQPTRQSIQNWFSPTRKMEPHVDKQYFDTSLVEIRPTSDDASKSTENVNSDQIPEKHDLDDVWIKRESKSPATNTSKHVHIDEPDVGVDRPVSAPVGELSVKSSKKSKKEKEEARRQEKEQRKNEKEARRRKEEAARQLERMEKEAAKLEKLNRSNEKIYTRSVERVSGRSGSLERRRSGDGTVVLNQSTVHGTASPSRRPTIFDVFRPRRGSDPKKQKEKDPSKGSGSDKDSNNGSTGGGSSGIMHSMKVAMQHTGLIGHSGKSGGSETQKEKVKDGSAHPHAGSHAQYYHTVTAVRRADVSKSPMTKVMDLFRHRSNSAMSDADKRKAEYSVLQEILYLNINIKKKN